VGFGLLEDMPTQHSIRLPDATSRAVRAHAKALRVPIAVVLRDAIAAHVATDLRARPLIDRLESQVYELERLLAKLSPPSGDAEVRERLSRLGFSP
jgi:predicted transcriptional regulator